MKRKIDNYSWTQGFLYGCLFLILIILSGKSVYRAINEVALYEAKVVLFILGIVSLLVAIIIFIKASKRFMSK